MNIISYTNKMLKDWKKVGFRGWILDRILDELEALVQVVELEPDVVEPLSELVEVNFTVFVKNVELKLKVFWRIESQGLKKVTTTILDTNLIWIVFLDHFYVKTNSIKQDLVFEKNMSRRFILFRKST